MHLGVCKLYRHIYWDLIPGILNIIAGKLPAWLMFYQIYSLWLCKDKIAS